MQSNLHFISFVIINDIGIALVQCKYIDVLETRSRIFIMEAEKNKYRLLKVKKNLWW